jgi:hypothetical protein
MMNPPMFKGTAIIIEMMTARNNLSVMRRSLNQVSHRVIDHNRL